MTRLDADEEEGVYLYECDLPSCSSTATYEPDEEDDYPPEAPPGWFSVLVRRNGAVSTELAYCSHAHLVEGMEQHLPEARPKPPPPPSRWQEEIGVPLFILTLLIVLVLGVISGVGLLVDFAVWISSRM